MHERNMATITSRQKGRQFMSKFFTYLFLIIMAIIVLFPFYWMVISSLKTL